MTNVFFLISNWRHTGPNAECDFFFFWNGAKLFLNLYTFVLFFFFFRVVCTFTDDVIFSQVLKEKKNTVLWVCSLLILLGKPVLRGVLEELEFRSIFGDISEVSGTWWLHSVLQTQRSVGAVSCGRAVLPGEGISYSVSGTTVLIFPKTHGCRGAPLQFPGLVPPLFLRWTPFHRPSPAAAPPSASKAQINGQQNSAPQLWPSHAESTHQDFSLKWRNNEKGKKGVKRRTEVKKEVGRWWVKSLAVSQTSFCNNPHQLFLFFPLCLCTYVPMCSSFPLPSPATFPPPPVPLLPPLTACQMSGAAASEWSGGRQRGGGFYLKL